jgi:hypothetical protein
LLKSVLPAIITQALLATLVRKSVTKD